jgi:hypothetical protein
MTNDDWKTLRVPAEAWERAKAQKERADRTWGEQIVRPADGDSPDDAPAPAVDTDAVAERLADRLDYPDGQDVETIARRLESLESIESRVGSIERTLEGLQR